LRSAGASTLKGGELEATLRFSPKLSSSGSVGYTDSRYDRLTLQGIDLEGNKLPFSPSVTANVRLDYTAEVAGGEVTVSPSVTYTGSQYFTPYNAVNGYGPVRQGAYAIVDAVVEWRKGPWAVRGWAKNLTNEGVFTYGQDFAAFGYYYFNVNQPRTFGVAVRRTF
jgi:outer membrane receptor protein involved in Fe transport